MGGIFRLCTLAEHLAFDTTLASSWALAYVWLDCMNIFGDEGRIAALAVTPSLYVQIYPYLVTFSPSSVWCVRTGSGGDFGLPLVPVRQQLLLVVQ
jgi:hypothetical protein